MRNNINNWKVLNKNLPIFALFCFLGILYLGCRVSFWYFLFFGFMPFLLWRKEINIFQLAFLLIMALIFSILVIFVWQYGLVQLYRQYSPQTTRKAIFNFFDTHYSQEMASFIKLILFNVKSKDSYIFYKQTVDLGIVWLFCISGFHIALLSKIITWCFHKRPTIGRYVNISVILFYSYLLNFSFASLRILLKIIFQPLFSKTRITSFNKIGFIGIIICLLNPCCFKDYGFLLSFLICIGSCCVSKLDLNSKIINKILINLVAFIITIPFVINMNHKISLFSLINVFTFNFISPFFFLYFLIFAWMPFMSVVHYGLIVAIYAIVGNISFSNIFIYVNQWKAYAIAIYYIMLFVIMKITYLIVINNKI